jgi:hypothetical protein
MDKPHPRTARQQIRETAATIVDVSCAFLTRRSKSGECVGLSESRIDGRAGTHSVALSGIERARGSCTRGKRAAGLLREETECRHGPTSARQQDLRSSRHPGARWPRDPFRDAIRPRFANPPKPLAESLYKTSEGECRMTVVNHSGLPLSYCQLLVKTVSPLTRLRLGPPEQSRSQVKRG